MAEVYVNVSNAASAALYNGRGAVPNFDAIKLMLIIRLYWEASDNVPHLTE